MPAGSSPPPTTEAWDRALFDLDIRPPEAAALALLEAHRKAAVVAYDAADHLAVIARRATVGIFHGGRVVFLGAGTSGRLSQAAARREFGSGPAFGVLAGDGLEPGARRSAEDDLSAGISAVSGVRGGLGRWDTVIGVSASGGARYVQGALQRARYLGAYPVAVVNNAATPIADFGPALVLATGAEPIKGSTRLKAGTAQKIVLDTVAGILAESHAAQIPLHELVIRDRIEHRLDAHLQAVMAAEAVAAEIGVAAQEIPAKLAAGGRMVFLGPGAAGEVAAQEAAELPPTFGLAEDKSLGFVTGSAGYEPRPADVVIGLFSGTDNATDRILAHAAEVGALTVGIASSSRMVALERLAHVVVLPEIEHLEGAALSTGFKAALNSLTTLTMVYDNRTYGNLMTNVTPANEKLRNRMVTTASEATGVPEAEASAALTASGYELPTAIVSLNAGVDPSVARQRLAEHGNSIRSALGERRRR